MKRLIVNADDFGLTPGVNRAIVQAHRQGIVTSSTLMANGGAFGDAVAQACSCPELSVGCHVVLVDGRPLSPAPQVRTLLAGSDGHFRQGFLSLAGAALGGGLSSTELEAEIVAQVRKLQDAGVAVSHLDSHKHSHVFPAVFRALLRAARRCGVRAVRNPFEPARLQPLWSLGWRKRAWSRYPAVRLMGCFAGAFRRRVAQEGLITTDGTLGITVTGCLDAFLLQDLVRRIPDGTWELLCHPASDTEDLRGVTSLGQASVDELGLLSAPATRALLQSCGVQLVSYAELAGR